MGATPGKVEPDPAVNPVTQGIFRGEKNLGEQGRAVGKPPKPTKRRLVNPQSLRDYDCWDRDRHILVYMYCLILSPVKKFY